MKGHAPERAEVVALSVLRRGQGRHELPAASGFTRGEVSFHLDDVNRVTVNLFVGEAVAYSFDIEVKIAGLNPNPDELWESSEANWNGEREVIVSTNPEREPISMTTIRQSLPPEEWPFLDTLDEQEQKELLKLAEANGVDWVRQTWGHLRRETEYIRSL